MTTHPHFRSLFLALLLLMAVALVPTGHLAAQEATPEPTAEPLAEGTVSTVNGVEIPAAQFQERVRATRFLYGYTIRETALRLIEQGIERNQAAQAVQSFFSNEINLMLVGDLLGGSVLGDLERETILKQMAEEQGITVSEDDVQEQIDSFIDRPRALTAQADAPPEPTAEATEETLQSTVGPVERLYIDAETQGQVSRAAIDDYFMGQALRAKFAEQQLGAFPTEWTYITTRHILLNTEEEANDVIARLEAGEDFAALAQELSIDQNSGAQGGELGTVVPELFIDEFANAVRDAELNTVIGPIQTEFGFHIIEVTARETRPLDANGTTALRRQRISEFAQWLEDQRTAATVERVSTWPDLIPLHPSGEELLSTMLGDL